MPSVPTGLAPPSREGRRGARGRDARKMRPIESLYISSVQISRKQYISRCIFMF